MLKKKVVIKSKNTRPKEALSRPSLSATPKEKESNAQTSRVYTLNKPSVLPRKSTYKVNNMVKLKINIDDINRLEKDIGHKGLLHGIETPQEPMAWNVSSIGANIKKTETLSQGTVASDNLNNTKNPFKSLIKRNITNIKTDTNERITRKDLIINSGVKRSTKPIMQLYSHGWPAHSSHACWYCCHTFNNTPVGIPQILVQMEFHCYGNFCSYNCAKRYLRPETEDDMAMLQTCNDAFIDDDLGERMQLLELLCHIETGSPINQPIKPAPRRLTLTLFGGNKSIEEFRDSFSTNDSYHVFRSPLVPISYQMEECNDKTERKRRQRVSLDTVKIERAYSELAEQAKMHKANSGLSKRMVKINN